MQAFDTYDRLPTIVASRRWCCTGPKTGWSRRGTPRLLAARIPGAELHWLEGAGHLYHSEQADAADAAVLDFIARRAP